MIYEKIYLDKNNENVYLEAYIADPIGDFVRNAILVIPGGGYSNICSDREGEPIGMAFMPYGYNAFVLHYSVAPAKFPTQLTEASAAVAHIRDNAEKYNINPDKIFAVGFSAGGHLAASLGTMWHRPEITEALGIPYGHNKPNGMMLIYPVLSRKYHDFSFDNLLQDDKDNPDMQALCSIENNVDENSAPAFIMCTSNDQTVDARNSLALANKLAEKKIKFELHIYPDAPHGVALGNKITKCGEDKYCNPAIAKWVENAAFWAENL